MQLSNTEKDAWSVFYTRFAPRIFAYISRQVANVQDAEDLLLEVFLSAHRESALGKLPEEQQLAWLRRVARNKLIDYYRRQGLIRWLPLAEASELEANEQYQFTLDVIDIAEGGNETVVTTLVSVNFDGSPIQLHFHFTLTGDKIAALSIRD